MPEVLLNAIVHRDYAVPTPIQIRVYEDRLSIRNPGELPENWTQATLLGSHASRPYNPDIAHAFFRAGEIEAWGRGMERIFGACRQAGTPEPLLRLDARDFWFEFPFSEIYLGSLTSGEEAGRGLEKTTQETTQEQILALLREDSTLTRKVLADRIGITPDGVKYHLDKLRDTGRIRHVGPTKKGRWEVPSPMRHRLKKVFIKKIPSFVRVAIRNSCGTRSSSGAGADRHNGCSHPGCSSWAGRAAGYRIHC